jgi:integrase/recombinase XerD
MDFDDFKKNISDDKSENTVQAYISDLKQFFQIINKDPLFLINEDVEKFKEELINKGYKIKTINRKLVSLKRYIDFYNMTSEEKIFLMFKLIKIQKQEYLDEILNKSDFERLIRFAERANDVRAIAIFYSLYLTGVRVSELLQWKVETAKHDTIIIRGKGGKYRNVMISDNLSVHINEYIRHRKHKKNGYLFLNEQNNKRMTRKSVHNLIKKYAGKSKVKLKKAHAHSFRHLFCMTLIEKQVSIDTIADLAGHSDINTTRIYTRQTQKDLRKVINML